MKRGAKFAVFCVLLAASGWCVTYYRDWFLYYWQRDHIVRDINDFEQALRQTHLPMESAGMLQSGSQQMPLWVVRKPALVPHAKTICLIGSIHGNEPAGAQTILALAQDMAREPERYAQLNYVMVPMANPWGWAHALRRNAQNQDIAREFAGGQSPESTLLKAVIQQARCQMLVDLHEDRFHAGFYLLAYAPPSLPAVYDAVSAIEQRTGVRRAAKPPQGVWHIPESGFNDIYLTTAPLWARQNGVPLAFIVESHDAPPLAQRINIHAVALEELTRLLVHTP